ncbi:MAG TPA: restriction endonuclease subunit S, partial [Bacteroides togonis]|nr:restriction endonuclease subunit S [Bacteroides togonis]
MKNKDMEKGNEIKTVVPTLRFPEFQNTEGWKEYKLKSLCEIGNGKDYKHLDSGNIPVYGSGGYMTSVDDFLYDGESVCIGRKGTIDKPIFLTGKFWTVDTLFYTHSFHDCLPKFLYLIFQQINWYKYNEAGGVPSLSKTTIGEINVFVPVGEKGELKEQQKIVDCIFSLDELIEATAQKVGALKEHKKGLMQRLFPAEGKNVPDLRFPEFQGMNGWEKTYIYEECPNPYSGGTPKTTEKKYYGGNIPFIRSAEIGKDKTELSITQEGLNNSSAKMIQKGDLLIALYGANSGDIAISKIDGAINQAILCIKAKSNNLFIYYTLLKKQKYI